MSSELPEVKSAEDIFFEGSDTPWYKQPGLGQDPVRAMAGRIIRADYYRSLLTGSPIGSMAESKSRLMLGKLSGMDESLGYTQMNFGVQTQNRDQKFRLLTDTLNADALHASSPTRHHKWTNPFSSSPEEIRSGDTLSFLKDCARIQEQESQQQQSHKDVDSLTESFSKLTVTEKGDPFYYLKESRMQEEIATARVVAAAAEGVGLVMNALVVKPLRHAVCHPHPGDDAELCKKAAIILKEAAKKTGVSDFIKEVQQSFVHTREQVMVPILQKQYGISPEVSRQYMADAVVAPTIFPIGGVAAGVLKLPTKLSKVPVAANSNVKYVKQTVRVADPTLTPFAQFPYAPIPSNTNKKGVFPKITWESPLSAEVTKTVQRAGVKHIDRPISKMLRRILNFLNDESGTIPVDKKVYSSKEMVRLFREIGYEIVPGGKGSHIKLKKADCPTVIVPFDKELPKGTANFILNKYLEASKKD